MAGKDKLQKPKKPSSKKNSFSYEFLSELEQPSNSFEDEILKHNLQEEPQKLSEQELSTRGQLLIKAVVPKIAQYLREEVAPLVHDTTKEIFISSFNLERIKRTIGESLWQNGLQIIPNTSLTTNPFAKALSYKSISTAADTQIKPQQLDKNALVDFDSDCGKSLDCSMSMQSQPNLTALKPQKSFK